jgi:hypothetical protein
MYPTTGWPPPKVSAATGKKKLTTRDYSKSTSPLWKRFEKRLKKQDIPKNTFIS